MCARGNPAGRSCQTTDVLEGVLEPVSLLQLMLPIPLWLISEIQNSFRVTLDFKSNTDFFKNNLSLFETDQLLLEYQQKPLQNSY